LSTLRLLIVMAEHFTADLVHVPKSLLVDVIHVWGSEGEPQVDVAKEELIR